MKLIPKSVIRKVNRFAGKAVLKLRKRLPDILVVVGISASTGAIVAASVETTKIDPILDTAKDNIDQIHDNIDSQPDEESRELAIADSKHQLTKVYIRTAMRLTKVYLPAIALQTLSIACTLSGHRLMAKRNMELVAAYTALFNGFRAYRGRVVDKYGEDADYDLYYNTATRTIIDSETGEETKVHEMTSDPDDYLIVFDSSNPNYDINPIYCKNTLMNTQHYANDLLYARGYVFLNDILEDLNMAPTTRGQAVGWCLDENDPDHDNFVDLRITEVQRTRPDGLVETIFTMDPNVDGTIIYKLEKVAK